MMDHDLAKLYGVPTKALKQAVRRNMDRFPSDFMFELTKVEFANLRSQIVTSSSPQWGGTRYTPMAFTEQGIAMLSSILRSKRAVQVNIAIMRVFVRLREMMATHKGACTEACRTWAAPQRSRPADSDHFWGHSTAYGSTRNEEKKDRFWSEGRPCSIWKEGKGKEDQSFQLKQVCMTTRKERTQNPREIKNYFTGADIWTLYK